MAINYARRYLKAIHEGKVVVSEPVRMVYERLEAEQADKSCKYRFDLKLGLHAIEFIETFCRHYEGELAGQLVKLDLWQKAFIQTLFGWVDKKTKLRRFREFMLLVARKNGKSMLSACIMVYMLVADGEAGAQCVSIATKYDQAAIVYKTARKIIEQDPELDALVRPIVGGMEFKLTNSTMKALASKSKTLDGLNLHYCSCDELHAQEDRNLYDVTKQGMKARKQPIYGSITTAGFAREGIYDSMFEYALSVANGTVVDDRFLPMLYMLDNREEWMDPAAWQKANPGLGTIKSREQLADDVERAKNDPSYLPTLLVKDFNIQESAASAWLPFAVLKNEEVAPDDYLNHSYAIGGCDLSATTDLTCATLLIKRPKDPKFYVLQQYFLPKARVEQIETQGRKEAPYRLWAKQGHLTLCDTATVDYNAVTAWYVKMVQERDIRPLWVCYDAALSGYWVPQMTDTGFDMERIRQGPVTWTYPMKRMKGLFEDGLIVYQNNPMLRWCLSNTAAKASNQKGIDSIQPEKITANRRIDGMVSLLNAMVGYYNHEEEFLQYLR
ncbi:terminase large subunit [Desulfovibrio piger]|uniref:terminase large subunit n=1 Tax=Desulfovibrio piger TaxID=901 RepID=UPI0026EB0EE0|nr:terminase large subunit [Desulfovibrio piger]